MLSLIDPARLEAKPWKNGGGYAIDFASENDCDNEPVWRVGTAAITRDGPFSDYDGVARTFAIVEGPGVVLEHPGRTPLVLERDEIARFPGRQAPFARLRHGPVTAFNLMTRDGAAAGDYAFVPQSVETIVEPADRVVLFAIDAALRATGRAGDVVTIPKGFAARATAPARLAVTTTGRAIAVRISLARS